MSRYRALYKEDMTIVINRMVIFLLNKEFNPSYFILIGINLTRKFKNNNPFLKIMKIIPRLHKDKKKVIHGVRCVYAEITTNAGTHSIWVKEATNEPIPVNWGDAMRLHQLKQRMRLY